MNNLLQKGAHHLIENSLTSSSWEHHCFWATKWKFQQSTPTDWYWEVRLVDWRAKDFPKRRLDVITQFRDTRNPLFCFFGNVGKKNEGKDVWNKTKRKNSNKIVMRFAFGCRRRKNKQKCRKINERFDFHLTFAAWKTPADTEISREDVEKQYGKLGKGDCDEMVPINLNLIPRGEMKVRTHKQTEGKKFLSGISGKIIPIWFMKGKKTTPLISRGLSVTSREKKETP